MTDQELDALVAEAREWQRSWAEGWVTTGTNRLVGNLADALTALRAENGRLRESARIMSNYIADYQMDEAEDRRACIDDEHHKRAAEALEAARALGGTDDPA